MYGSYPQQAPGGFLEEENSLLPLPIAKLGGQQPRGVPIQNKNNRSPLVITSKVLPLPGQLGHGA